MPQVAGVVVRDNDSKRPRKYGGMSRVLREGFIVRRLRLLVCLLTQ